MAIHGESPQSKAATASAPAVVTVGLSSVVLLADNAWRRSYAVQNTHSLAVVYLGFDHDATTDGIRLTPGQTWSDEGYRGDVNAISTYEATAVAVVEFGG